MTIKDIFRKGTGLDRARLALTLRVTDGASTVERVLDLAGIFWIGDETCEAATQGGRTR